MQNGLALYNKHGELIDLRNGEHEGHESNEEEEFDTEDQGQKGFNYRSERYGNRLKEDDDLTLVMDSCIHGDPATPLFRAYTGDNVKVRLIILYKMELIACLAIIAIGLVALEGMLNKVCGEFLECMMKNKRICVGCK